MENKEYHDDGFQQQNNQAAVNKYKHMNRRRIAMIIWLNAMPFKYCLVR